MVPHPGYNTVTLENDVAVVTLRGMPPPRELRRAGVYPVTLNSARGAPAAGTEVSLTGWGLTSGSGGGVVAAELATTRMRVAPTADCVAYLVARALATVGIDDARMICASLGDETSSCSGDSGGTFERFLFFFFQRKERGGGGEEEGGGGVAPGWEAGWGGGLAERGGCMGCGAT